MQPSESDEALRRCIEARSLVFEFLDDELMPAQVAIVVEHLAACNSCAGFFAFERTFLGVLRRRVPIDEAPPDLRERLRAALADRKRPGPPT